MLTKGSTVACASAQLLVSAAVVWGFGAVGMSEQAVGPPLISKGMDMPLVWVTLGIFGEAIALGAPRVFIGPTKARSAGC